MNGPRGQFYRELCANNKLNCAVSLPVSNIMKSKPVEMKIGQENYFVNSSQLTDTEKTEFKSRLDLNLKTL
jgi:hypothetical protein